tara:strand:+ start:103 stop:1653 length:1551 start_codon:yes stop_codon:yes gene_type:complete
MEAQELLEEFKKCKDDPIYFISNYIKVIHPMRGLVPFALYPFQKEIVGCLETNRFNILRKFRQAGCTTIASAYSLWMALFKKHQTIVILSKGDVEATEVLDRIKVMYEELPKFLQPGVEESNKHTFKLKSSSVIKSRPSGKQSGRSLAGSMLIIDEAAFIDFVDTIWAAVYPIISTGGRVFVLSTVNGVGNWYHNNYIQALEKENSFNAIDINWEAHPEYKRQEGYEHLYEQMEKKGVFVDKWEETTKKNMPVRQWLQEYECEFLGTGSTYVDGENLKMLIENQDLDFDIKYNNRMRVWKDPEPHYEYIMGVDVALGRDRDHSAFHIFNRYTGEQVAEFYSNKTPINEFAEIIATEGNYYNLATVLVERNTIGNNLIDWLFNMLEYENLWMTDNGEFGIQVSTKNREELLARMEEYIRVNAIKINSKRTIDELLTFIINKSGKAEADTGKNDDLVMSLALSINILHTLSESNPIETSKGLNTERDKPLASIMARQQATLKTAHGGVTQEEIKWLMK